MSIRKSITMLANTGTEWTVYSKPARGNAYYGYGDGMHTVQVIYTNFVGAIGIQATLALEPKDEDWFFIKLDRDSKLVHYPANQLHPQDRHGDTGSDSFTFTGNYTYVRAVVYREHLCDRKPADKWTKWEFVQVDKFLLSL